MIAETGDDEALTETVELFGQLAYAQQVQIIVACSAEHECDDACAACQDRAEHETARIAVLRGGGGNSPPLNN